MRRNQATSLVGLVLIVLVALLAAGACIALALHVGNALRPFLARPAYPMTWGELLTIVIVLAVLLEFRR